MVRFLLILILLYPVICSGQSRPVSVDDLLTLSSQAPKNFDNYLNKKGFLPGNRGIQGNAMEVTFFEKRNSQPDTLAVDRSIDLYKKEDSYYFVLHTTSAKEYREGLYTLKKAAFFYDNSNDSSGSNTLMFQKGSITVLASAGKKDSIPVYTFSLEKKEFPNPGTIRYAEDLLKFDSHEHLVSYFGQNNVKEDVYYLSDKDSRKCSVLFPNSSRQAVFVWEDPNNLYKISFIVISGVLPTASAVQFNRSVSQNTWMLRAGIYSGMRVKDLLELNGNDFQFYGLNSEFPFMIEPEKTRNIDFRKVGIMLDCFNCNGSPMMNKLKVSASDAVDNGLALHVSYIMISP
jgi:hypothetical protein